MSEYNECFDSKYPDATCHRCEKKVDGESVVYCGGGGGECETWYCADCYEDGTDDCPVCKSMEATCIYCDKEAQNRCDECGDSDEGDGGAMCDECVEKHGCRLGIKLLCGGCYADSYCAKINGERDYCECSKCEKEEDEWDNCEKVAVKTVGNLTTWIEIRKDTPPEIREQIIKRFQEEECSDSCDCVEPASVMAI